MSSTPLTPNSSPSVYPSSSDNSTTTTPPPSDPSALPPTPDSSPPNSSTPRSTPPPTNSPPVFVTPPPSNSEPPTSPPPGVIPPPSPPPRTRPASSPPPSIPPPATPPTTNAPPPSIPSPVTPSTPIAPPPSIPTPVAPSTPSAPPSAVIPSTPNAPPPFIPPSITPSTPSAPPPIDISPPPPIVPQSPPPKNSPSRPSPSPPLKPEVPPHSPPAVIPPSPSPPVHTSPPPSLPVPPKQSLPTPAVAPPPADLSGPPDSEVLSPPNTTFPPPSVPASASPSPPQNNTPIPPSPTTASTPSTPTENAADSTPPSTNGTTASTTREGGGFPAGGAIAIVFVGLLALSLLVFSAWFVQTRKKKRTGLNQGYMAPSPFVSSQNSDQNAAIGSAHRSPHHSAHLNGSSSTTKLAYTRDPSGIGNSVPWFTYEELIEGTNGFSEENLLGEGGFGCVYKGNLSDGREVAVKQLKIGGKQGEREFRAEVEIISRIHHRHLVSIVGYCISDIQRLLVYDYVPNNTLHYHLHGNVSVMTWETRLKVATGAARGIAYLHEDCTPLVIHRDIKSANILLDSNFEAKVADFGLAKLALELEAHTHVSTRVMGTFGCMAPEYATTGKLTEKSDVFSFGVVLLELITGRKPVDSSQPLGEESLVGWARPLLTKALETEVLNNLVDPRLEINYVKIQMLRLIEAAAACVRHSALKRPKMSQVVRALDSIVEISDLSNGMKPGDSQIIYSREQSAQISMFQRMAFGSQEYGIDFSGNSRSSWSGL